VAEILVFVPVILIIPIVLIQILLFVRMLFVFQIPFVVLRRVRPGEFSRAVSALGGSGLHFCWRGQAYTFHIIVLEGSWRGQAYTFHIIGPSAGNPV